MNDENNLTIFWFRRDLRLEDNHALYRALGEAGQVMALFIYDTEILEKLETREDPRIDFIQREAEKLKERLEKSGSTLLVKMGKPGEVFRELTESMNIRAVYFNRDYEPYARKRDREVSRLLEDRGIRVRSFGDQVVFEPHEVLKEDGKPYTVYTPYMRKWKRLFGERAVPAYPSETLMHRFARVKPAPGIGPEELGFHKTETVFPSRNPEEESIRRYHDTRDYPALEGTSRLGIHLRFGTVSARAWAEKASRLNEKFLNELIWREFYMMILWHFPHVEHSAFRPAYDRVLWRNREDEFDAWCRGMTGYLLVDAGMRQLNATGYMHNRVRMVTASFLVKHLLIDWRWGEAYFASRLLDFELSSNNGGWQWAAGSGCDAAPYFRVFNPLLQQEKFDPGKDYIRRWIPEYGTRNYPKPIVDHKLARDRVISAYKQALNGI